MEHTLNQRISRFYDDSTPLWLNTWGEHMHHGHYGSDGSERKSHRQAQLDLIEAVLNWGDAGRPKRILDAGCGVGGSARYLARKFDAAVTGYTLSGVQAARGQEYNIAAGLEEQVELHTGDVTRLSPETAGTFDLIWSLESAEHMADKRDLLDRFHRLLRPGGQLLLVTWCHRSVPPALDRNEQQLLEKICELYHLPPLISLNDYERLARLTGFGHVQTADWTSAVAPFWKAVIRSALNPRNWPGLMRSGPGTIKGAWAMRYMVQGYRQGTLQFGLLQGKK